MPPNEPVTTYQVGFLIGPRLNAPGRLADALTSLRLLCVKGPDAARALAIELDNLNGQRQDLLQRVVAEAKQVLAARPNLGAYVLADPGWPAGVCGLAAGKLVERVYRPVVVMEEQDELCRGSARSIKGFDITAALTSMADLLESFGGHAMAAGFVAKTANVRVIEQRLSEMVLNQLANDQLTPVLRIDAEVALSELNLDLAHNLTKLEPCGMGNPQPVFVTRGLDLAGSRLVGKEAKH
jgi:single-stranded-DNA-specific exonuclease